jgi:quercetin dioxygenase-like cupin family protein
MDPYFYINDLITELPEIPANSIVSKALYKDSKLSLTLFGFATGQELSEHTAATTAILHFLQGEADVTLGNETKPAGPGTWIYMPPHMPHTIFAKTPVTMLLILLAS